VSALPETGSRVLVAGLGASGLALVRFLLGRGMRVRVADRKPASELEGSLSQVPEGDVELRAGEEGEDLLDGCAAVYASPGMPWDAALLEAARARGLIVSSEIDLFFELCPAPIVGITGTNGKTTTASMTASVLAQGPRPVLLGGNIGDTVLDRLDEVRPEHWVVLELSSFQLESCRRPRTAIAAVLNVTPDHLDRHHTMAAYIAAKARLVEAQDAGGVAILNGQDPICVEMAETAPGRVVWFDAHSPVPEVPVPGRHNQLNALAAAAVGRAAGLDDDRIQAGIAAFTAVEHRLELVEEIDGVAYYNDSKATNPEAGLVALESFPGRPVVLIAGGYGSGFELSAWVAAVRARTEAAVLIGESADLLAGHLEGHLVRRAGSLEQAVDVAGDLARSGGVVLLSPAYKSYDMFRNYGERGRTFKAAVRARAGAK
jgi:UDP-N-acetylmuramoylalanine--D-glutamate ligase